MGKRLEAVPSEAKDISGIGESAEGESAEQEAEKAAASPDDPMECPRCGGRKMRKKDRLCRTCYFAEKDRAKR